MREARLHCGSLRAPDEGKPASVVRAFEAIFRGECIRVFARERGATNATKSTRRLEEEGSRVSTGKTVALNVGQTRESVSPTDG